MSVADDFWSQVLALIGAPASPNNIAVLNAWSAHEGTSATWNPLATTQGQGTNFNSTGVKSFATEQAGVQATANTLLNGRYGHIVAALRGDVPLSTWLQGGAGVGPELRVWSGGGYSSLGNSPAYMSPAFGGAQLASNVTPTTGGCISLGDKVSGGIPGISGVAGFFSWLAQPCVWKRLLIQGGSVLLILWGLKFVGQPEPLHIAATPLRAARAAA